MSLSTNVYAILGAVAPFYDRVLESCGHASCVDRFVRALYQEARGDLKTVLDAGCGLGHYSTSVLRQFPDANVTAFDLEDSMTEHFEKSAGAKGFNGRLHIFQGDVIGPLSELRGRQFRAVITGGLLEHVPVRQTVAKLAEFLEPNGYFLNAPVRDNLWAKCFTGPMYGFTPLKRNELISVFEENGFALKKLVETSLKEAQIYQKQ